MAHFLKFFRSPREDAGKLIRIVLAWTQFQSGLPFPILSLLATDISYMDGRYFHFVMAYLNEIGGTVTHISNYTLPTLRTRQITHGISSAVRPFQQKPTEANQLCPHVSWHYLPE